jgi:predicted PurR-regulated permease PerM
MDEKNPLHNEPPSRQQLNWRSSWRHFWLFLRSITPSEIIRLVLVLLALWTLIWLILNAWAALLPFQLGVVVAYLLLPLVNQLEQRVSRGMAVTIVFGGGILILVWIIAVVVPPLVFQITAFLNALPSAETIGTTMSTLVNDIETYVGTLPPDLQAFIREGVGRALIIVRDNAISYAQAFVTFLVDTLLTVAGTFAFLLGFLIIPVWLIFVLLDQQKGLEAINNLLPAWFRADFWALLAIPDRIFSSYLRGQIFLAIIVFVASFVGLTVLQLFGVEGVQYTLMLAVFAGLMEFIPFIGPIIGAIPAIVVGMLHSWETALIIALLYLIIQQLENNLLIPKIIGESVRIHPAVVMTLLVILTQLGLIWFLLAAPLAATVRDLYLYIYGRVSDPPLPAGLLPGEPPPEPSAHPLGVSELPPDTREA